MKFKYNSLKTGILAFISLVLIVVTSFLFILQMNKMIETNTVNTITELAEHDMSTIIKFVETNWRSLENISKRLKVYDCNTLHDAQARLNLERTTSDFYSIFLIDEDNVIYSDRYAIYKDDELQMLSKLEWQDRKQIVRRFDYSTHSENRREMILYASKIDGFEIDGKQIVSIVGISNINTIKENLIIHYFNNGYDNFRGYSSVVNYYGDYIVNMNKSASLYQRQNVFNLLDAGEIKGGLNSEQITKKMTDNETFRLAYTDSAGVEKLLYFMPINETPWYFISMVEKKVFTEQTQTFVVISISMICVAIVIVALMIILVANSNREAMFARAETKARSEFLSNMSHEIRTPLNGIIGLLYLMRSHLYDKNPKQMEELLGKADDSAEYLLGLVSDILDISKLRAEKLKLNSEPFRLDKMLTSVADMQRNNAESRGIFLKLNSKISIPNVIGDEIRLKQVLMNIVGNAVKFTPAGGKITIAATQSKCVNNHVDVTIVCSDTGIGMSDDFLKTIWDSFTQENNKLSNGIRGTGLGMAITKGIIDAMGGTISVKSKLNEGSTFTINLHLPVNESAILKKDKLIDTDVHVLESGQGMKLIIAEDNELNSEILMEILKGQGFEVTAAENGKIAYNIFLKSEPNEYQAILMDMQMPVMDGCEATKQIRQSNHPNAKTIPIFACTANVFQEDKDKALGSGMNDFLVKPIDVDVLLEKLTNNIFKSV